MVSFSKKKKDKDDTKKNERLETGLDALLIDHNPKKTATSVESVPKELILIKGPPSMFYAEEQVRTYFDEHEIIELSASMASNGQIHPIIVYPADTDGPNKGKHKIDKGERRWRAASLIEGFELQARVDYDARNRTEERRITGQIVENDQGKPLKLLDMAKSIKDLMEQGLSQQEIATRLGWLIKETRKPNINKVSRVLNITKLPEEGRKLVEDGVVEDMITLEHLRKIFHANPMKFSLLCDIARSEDGLTRKRAEQEYKLCVAIKENEKTDKDFDQVNTSNNASEKEDIGQAQASDLENHSPQEEREELNANDEQPLRASLSTPSQSPESSIAAVLNAEPEHGHIPVIRIKWINGLYGKLELEKEPEEKGYAWIRLDSGDVITAELDDLRIVEIIY